MYNFLFLCHLTLQLEYFPILLKRLTNMLVKTTCYSIVCLYHNLFNHSLILGIQLIVNHYHMKSYNKHFYSGILTFQDGFEIISSNYFSIFQLLVTMVKLLLNVLDLPGVRCQLCRSLISSTTVSILTSVETQICKDHQNSLKMYFRALVLSQLLHLSNIYKLN